MVLYVCGSRTSAVQTCVFNEKLDNLIPLFALCATIELAPFPYVLSPLYKNQYRFVIPIGGKNWYWYVIYSTESVSVSERVKSFKISQNWFNVNQSSPSFITIDFEKKQA